MKTKTRFLTAFLLSSISILPSLSWNVIASTTTFIPEDDDVTLMTGVPIPKLKIGNELRTLQESAKQGNAKAQKEMFEQAIYYNNYNENYNIMTEDLNPQVMQSLEYFIFALKFASHRFTYGNYLHVSQSAEQGNRHAQYAMGCILQDAGLLQTYFPFGRDELPLTMLAKSLADFIPSQLEMARIYFSSFQEQEEKDRKFLRILNLPAGTSVQRHMFSFVENAVKHGISGSRYLLGKVRVENAVLRNAGEAWKYLTSTFTDSFSSKAEMENARGNLCRYFAPQKENLKERTQTQEEAYRNQLRKLQKTVEAIEGAYDFHVQTNNNDLGETTNNNIIAENAKRMLEFNKPLNTLITLLNLDSLKLNDYAGFMVNNVKVDRELSAVDYTAESGENSEAPEVRFYPELSMYCIGKKNVELGDELYKALYLNGGKVFSHYRAEIQSMSQSILGNISKTSVEFEDLRTKASVYENEGKFIEENRKNFENYNLPFDEAECKQERNEELKKLIKKSVQNSLLLQFYNTRRPFAENTHGVEEIPELIKKLLLESVGIRNQKFARQHDKLF